MWVRPFVRACGSVLDRKLLERLMSPSTKSQVMFASAFSWIGDFSNFWDSYFSSYGEFVEFSLRFTVHSGMSGRCVSKSALQY